MSRSTLLLDSELGLTPEGILRYEGENSAVAPLFEEDWREGLFLLAAKKLDTLGQPALRFWQSFAARFLTSLCHLPPQSELVQPMAPEAEELEKLILASPPMRGGEYLSGSLLNDIWGALSLWSAAQSQRFGSLSEFLAAKAPKWNQVGRVCFHLAENKQSEERPFAFLATYSVGFTGSGKVRHLPLRKALEQYAGENNKDALRKLLTPVSAATQQCEWVRGLVETGAVYRPTGWTVEQAYRFLSDVPLLEESGLTVRIPNWWKKRARPQVTAVVGESRSGVGADALLDFKVDVALGDESLTPEELRRILTSSEPLVLLRGQWVEVDSAKLREAMSHWETLEQQGEVSFIEGMRLLAGASPDLQQDARPGDAWVRLQAGASLEKILAGLREPTTLSPHTSPNGLKATLRPYQEAGLNWLRFLTGLGMGACLADDMGLGKTVQVLALLLTVKAESKSNRPSLLVLPASLLGNWKAEAEKFAPSLNLLFCHASELGKKGLQQLANDPSPIEKADLVITTYSMTTRLDWLAEHPWKLVILDEAQAIKNPGTRQTKAVKGLKAQAKIALTGTPVENRLGDLWSLFDFLNPGLLGTRAVFRDFIAALQSKTENQFAPLRKLVSPYILRRLKTDDRVVADLPEKVEVKEFCTLTPAQVKLYKKTLDKMKADLDDTDGMQRRGVVLQALSRLKQICNHPSQLTGDSDHQAKKSGKFQRLGELCEEIASRQEKVLVFTQFREIIDPLADYLTTLFRRPGIVLHGGTAVKKRQELVDLFQSKDGPPFFILSLKAGGTGLNLTRAGHVIHFDRWWNPAVENQATDRAFRIGQKRNVLVHKFVTQGTLEERIDQMLEQKQAMADELLSREGEVNLTELSDREILDLVSLDVSKQKVT